MLHRVTLPDCAKALEEILQLQEDLLDLACTADPTDLSILNRRFRPEVVRWLWRHKQKLLDPLESFYRHHQLREKQSILQAFRHDITYDRHLDDATFAFELQPKLPGATELSRAVGKWLENFYDVVSRCGAPATVTGYTCHVDQQALLGDFQSANSQVHVCPMCDGTFMERTKTGRIGSVDHFLPRAVYPALAVHPVNLLPICIICNERVKKDKDPLTEGQQRTLADLFVPYFRPACQTVTLRIDPSSEWEFQGAQGTTQAQLTSFPALVALPDRWQGRDDEIDRLARRRLRDRVSAVRDTGYQIDSAQFARMVNRLVDDMRSEWGISPYLYPATWYLAWLRDRRMDQLTSEFLS